MAAESLGEFPPSAKLVYRALGDIEPATRAEIVEETELAERTTGAALEQLRDGGLVLSRPNPRDARGFLYERTGVDVDADTA